MNTRIKHFSVFVFLLFVVTNTSNAQSRKTEIIEPNQGHFGFALGVLYGKGTAYDGEYVEGAYVDLYGRMHARENRNSVVRTLPAVTVLTTPWALNRCNSLACELRRLAMAGVTVGFGSNNDKDDEDGTTSQRDNSGLSILYGGTIGIAGENFHLGIVYGLHTEQGLYSRPDWLVENDIYPLAQVIEPTLAQYRQRINRGNLELLSASLAIGVEIPLPKTTANYIFRGFVISFVF